MKKEHNITALDIVNSINHMVNEMKQMRMEIESLKLGNNPEPKNNELGMLTRREFAQACKVSQSTIQRWVDDGKVKPIRLGKRLVRFMPHQVIMGVSN